MGEADGSFKKPGAIPFKWEIRPGVPKTEQHSHHHHRQPFEDHQYYSVPSTPQKLTSPPAGSCLTPPPDFRTSSIRSMPSFRSDRHRYEPPLLSRPQVVSSGCFLAPWFRRKWGKKRSSAKPKVEAEPDYTSELETLARWSMSTRKSSPLTHSPSSSSLSSYRSSPRPVGDAEWAGYGLF